jgi:hypothetical protein
MTTIIVLIATHAISFAVGALVFRNNSTAVNNVINKGQQDANVISNASKQL